MYYTFVTMLFTPFYAVCAYVWARVRSLSALRWQRIQQQISICCFVAVIPPSINFKLLSFLNFLSLLLMLLLSLFKPYPYNKSSVCVSLTANGTQPVSIVLGESFKFAHISCVCVCAKFFLFIYCCLLSILLFLWRFASNSLDSLITVW